MTYTVRYCDGTVVVTTDPDEVDRILRQPRPVFEVRRTP